MLGNVYYPVMFLSISLVARSQGLLKGKRGKVIILGSLERDFCEASCKHRIWEA